MARSSPSSNNSYPTADPRRQQDEDDGDDNNSDDDHEHDVPDSPPQANSLASPPQARAFPPESWLPKRFAHPAPGSTLHSLSTAMMFGALGGGVANAIEDQQR
ncbi:hypothetical protein BGY98DRAFT_1103150 [Russula aff. rugulosa BPL654]|nr:hypothetical protein BGY98DRAFT_1103150 [Russula aff. rugulosa BPL654]